MSTDKKNDSENEQNAAEEPETAYRSGRSKIRNIVLDHSQITLTQPNAIP